METKSAAILKEAYFSLKGLQRPGVGFSDAKESERKKKTKGMRILSNTSRRVLVVIWGYCFAIWLYVIAFQLRYPRGVRDVLAWWLPIRMDYLSEGAFVLSFILALLIATHPPAKD